MPHFDFVIDFLPPSLSQSYRLLEDLDVVAVMTRLHAKQVLVQTRRDLLVTFPIRSRIAEAVYVGHNYL